MPSKNCYKVQFYYSPRPGVINKVSESRAKKIGGAPLVNRMRNRAIRSPNRISTEVTGVLKFLKAIREDKPCK